MMNPVVEEAEVEYKDQFRIVRFPRPSRERMELMRKFLRHVDMSYVPTFILTDPENRILSSGKGYVRQRKFYQLLDEGLEKGNKLGAMKIRNLLFLCRASLKACKETEEEVKAWITSTGKTKIKFESVDLDQVHKPKDLQELHKRLEGFKYLYGLEQIPALIATSANSEVVGMMQMIFSREDLQREFKGLY